jgi:hypothetical protein
MCEVAHTAVLLWALGWQIRSTPAGISEMTDRAEILETADTAPQAQSRDAIGQVLGWRRTALAAVCGTTAAVAIGGWICFLGWVAFSLAGWIVG